SPRGSNGLVITLERERAVHYEEAEEGVPLGQRVSRQILCQSASGVTPGCEQVRKVEARAVVLGVVPGVLDDRRLGCSPERRTRPASDGKDQDHQTDG